jgi:predicted ribosome quality control (RQC) complex YloA/Tae2 family protein
MAFDGALLWLMCNELRQNALGARVDKIYQPMKNQLVFFLRSKTFNGKLLLSADPGGARIQLTKATFENPASPPMLCMLLRKKLVGAKLSAIRQPKLERLVYLDFDTKNELGDPIKLTVIAELMGRNANLILCEENGRVIDAVRRTDASDTTRILMPGVTYMPPPEQNPFFLLEDSLETAISTLQSCQSRELVSCLLSAIPGISPIVCRELYHLSITEETPPDAPLTQTQLQSLQENLAQIKENLLSQKVQPTMVTDQNGKTVDFTFFAPTQYGDRVTLQHFACFSDLLDGFYTLRDQKAKAQAKTQNLNKWLTTTLARLARTVNVRTAELEKARNCDHLRIYGELLKANLGRIPQGATACRVVDYYDPQCKEIEIPLSPALSPQQNAQKYFKDYRKQCTAAGMLEGLIQKSQQDIIYLDSVKDALSRAMTDKEISAIQEELLDGGWLKNRKTDKKKGNKPKLLEPYEFLSCDGFVILAGRNNKQNDQLTLRQSNGNDIWFHTKNIPGSHVIVKTDGKEVPNSTLTQAAVIAATLSGGADSAGVAVDYCPVKRVKKPSGAQPGMVIYENYNTAFVNPDKGLVESLKQS